jgi:hypothetical protein
MNKLARHEMAERIAFKHIQWAMRQKMTPRLCLLDLQLKTARTWDEALDIIALSWLSLNIE